MILANQRPAKARVRRPLKLRVELIPKPLAKRNLRSNEGVGKARWDKLRRRLIKQRGRPLRNLRIDEGRDFKLTKSGIIEKMEAPGPRRFCASRSFASIATTSIIGGVSGGHFRVINDCRQKLFDDHFLKCARIWKRRSKKEWTIDWGKFGPLVEQAKEARDLWAKRNPDNGEYFNVRPGHHMPSRCPECDAIGTLTPIEVDQDEMSEGEEVVSCH